MKKKPQKEPFWTPDPENRELSQMMSFIKELQRQGEEIDSSFDSLHSWSIQSPDKFWKALSSFAGLRFSEKETQVLQAGDELYQTKWFPGAKLNFAENLIAHGEKNAKTALTFWNENGFQSQTSYQELFLQSAKVATAFREMGLKKGDVVAAFLPNIPETVIAMLATASIGAIWTLCAPGFSAAGALNRFEQVSPKLLLFSDGYCFKGKKFSSLEKTIEIAQKLPELENLIFVPYPESSGDIAKGFPKLKLQLWEELLQKPGANNFSFEQVEAEHPLCILYSSGTTGKPKCFLHNTIGTLLESVKEHILHTDLKSSDVLFYRSTTGWMMWNWMVHALYTGAKLVLYDGDLNAEILFEMAEKEQVTVFGSAAAHVEHLLSQGIDPAEKYDLSSLRCLLSTGSTLWPHLFDYIYEHIGKVQVSSISGGTDILGCFALGCPILPVYKGELQARSLGLDVDVFDSEGNSIRDEAGELVCKNAFPSMPLAFIGDEKGEAYQKAYFDIFPGVWAHGDSALIHSDTGGVEIFGRSDDILNPGGERFGPAAITSVADSIPGVVASTAVALRREGKERVVLFVKGSKELSLDEEFKAELKKGLPNPRYMPKYIVQVSDFPYTASGKLSNAAIRSVINRGKLSNKEALSNPQVLAEYEKLLQSGIFDDGQ